MKVAYKFNYIGYISTKYNRHMVYKKGRCDLFFADDISVADHDDIIQKYAENIKTDIKIGLSIQYYGRSHLAPLKWYQKKIPDCELGLFDFEKITCKKPFQDELYNVSYHFMHEINIDQQCIDKWKDDNIPKMDVE